MNYSAPTQLRNLRNSVQESLYMERATGFFLVIPLSEFHLRFQNENRRGARKMILRNFFPCNPSPCFRINASKLLYMDWEDGKRGVLTFNTDTTSYTWMECGFWKVSPSIPGFSPRKGWWWYWGWGCGRIIRYKYTLYVGPGWHTNYAC